MTDRELLEMAAKAAGLDGEWVEDSFLDDYYKLPTTGYLTVSEGRNHIWNPLTSSGDALRLAVKLGVDIALNHDIEVVAVDTNQFSVVPTGITTEHYNNNPYAATRRAIVRAAASLATSDEIGRNMK